MGAGRVGVTGGFRAALRPAVGANLLALVLAAGPAGDSAGAQAEAPAEPGAHVVVLFHGSYGQPSILEFDEAFRRELYERIGNRLRYDTDFLGQIEAGDSEYRESVEAYLRSKYAAGPDLVVAVGSPVLEFVLERRDRLFARSALVATHVERRDLGATGLPADVAGVVSRWDFELAAADFLRLRPETRRLVVVIGATEWERTLLGRIRDELQPISAEIGIDYWSGLPLGVLEERLAALPPDSAVLLVTYYRDEKGVDYIPAFVLSRVAGASKAPIFGLAGPGLGRGFVGGRHIDYDVLGRETADVVAARLAGRSAAEIGVRESRLGPPRFDARELRRWGIPRSRLPPGASVEFEQPTPWWRSWKSLVLLSLVLAEALLIAGLVFHRRRSRSEATRAGQTERIRAAVMDSLEEPVAVLDRDGVVLSSNEAWQAVAARRGKPGLRLGESFLGALRRGVEKGEDGVKPLLEAIERVLAEKSELTRFEYLEHHEGVQRWWRVTVAPLGREEGGVVIAAEEITADKIADERLSLALESLPTAALMVDDAGRIVLVNRACERLFGYLRAELVGKEVESLVPERFRVGHLGDRTAYTEMPTPRPMGSGRELRARRADGREVPVEIALQPIESSAGPMILCAIEDMTEKRRLERELQQYRAETAHYGRVAAAGELSAAIAHELNQPLTGILTNAQAGRRLLDGAAPDLVELGETLEDIAADGRRAGEVIHRLRSLLRRSEPELKVLDVNELVQQVVRLTGSDLLLRGAALDVELAPRIQPVAGDRVQLTQVILNLVLNALDAMAGLPPERRRVRLRTLPSAGREVRLEVRDAGVGIPSEAVPRIFEPFFTTKESGMGMGLAIVRSIVESHGGRIVAANNPSGGATFTVTLPAAAVAQNAVSAVSKGVA